MDSELTGHEVLRNLLKPAAADRSRLDGRPTSQRRSTAVVESGLVAASSPGNNVLGSAMVSHGSTLVLCTVTADLSPVLPDAPNRGYFEAEIVYNAATCYAITRTESATMQPAADDRDTLWTAEATSILQRAFDLSNCVNVDALGISEGEACWALRASCVVLQDDGGVLEACATAIRRALEVARMPTELALPDGSRQPWSPPASAQSGFLVGPPPALATIAFVYRGGASGCSKALPTEAEEAMLLVDPTAAEALVADGFVSVVVADKRLLSLTCHGGKAADPEILQRLVQFAEAHISN